MLEEGCVSCTCSASAGASLINTPKTCYAAHVDRVCSLQCTLYSIAKQTRQLIGGIFLYAVLRLDQLNSIQ